MDGPIERDGIRRVEIGGTSRAHVEDLSRVWGVEKKKWKEVLVNRQLFEMWNVLPQEEQKVWIDKATSFDKLF
jgi:hypothetical protein